MLFSRQRRWLVLFSLLIIAFAGIAFWPTAPPQQHYRMFESPDKRFRIVVEKKKSILARISPMPGQSGDAAGRVHLVDVLSNRVRKTEDVEMASLVEKVVWSETNVSVKFVADWPLP